MEKKNEFWILLAFVVSLVATGGSLYMSEFLNFIPCDLCWFQRIFMYPLTLLLGIAYLRNDRSIVPYLYPFIIIGAGFSLYHSIIQKLPPEAGVSACGLVPCQSDYLNWFGWLTIPMLALTAFVIILMLLLQIRKPS